MGNLIRLDLMAHAYRFMDLAVINGDGLIMNHVTDWPAILEVVQRSFSIYHTGAKQKWVGQTCK